MYDTVFGPHMDGDGFLQRTVPVFDRGLVIRLNEQIRALPSFQLRAAETHWSTLLLVETNWKVETPIKSSPPPTAHTSITCFLLDLSLEAHSTEPPLRSTVNSGLD